MKKLYLTGIIVLLHVFMFNGFIFSSTFIRANNPYIQYYGRWDMSNPQQPAHSWPGVYVYAEFTGTSIGVRINDNTNYYNVYIDGEFYCVFHGAKSGETDYTLVENLKNKRHTFRFSQRNISFDQVYTFSGFILDNGAKLLPPPPKPSLKIEFIGDSFTAAEGNEATEPIMNWQDKFVVTNIDKGFAPLIANHYNAQYHTTCRSGIGMVCDWQGNFDVNLPRYFNRTLMEKNLPKWDFTKWIPNLVVVCLGLNDISGLRGKDSVVSREKSDFFREGYHDFLATVRCAYPGVKILAVAAYPEWIRSNVKKVVDEEKADGNEDIYYAQFGYFNRGYVANGHPSVKTHKKMADQIIEQIDAINLFQKMK